MTTRSAESIEDHVRRFIDDNFIFGAEGDGISSEDSLLELGIIDSTGVLELVAFLEREFGIAIADRELLPENLDSIRNIVSFVAHKSAEVA